MTDFLMTTIGRYPWTGWLLVILAGAGAGYIVMDLAKVQVVVYGWLESRYKDLKWRSVVRNVGDDGEHLCPSCMVMAEQIGDDPPEYEHPDGDDLELPPEPSEDEVEAFLAEVKAMGLEKPAPSRCSDPECNLQGWVHPPPCEILPTLAMPKYLEGAALPPQPVREYLHPAIMDDLAERGFSEHETTDGALDSMFTRAQAAEVQAMITDGVVIPTDETGRSHHD